MLDRDALIQDIGSLMSTPLNGNRAARVASIERTLTDGYAVVLTLEGQRLRLEPCRFARSRSGFDVPRDAVASAPLGAVLRLVRLRHERFGLADRAAGSDACADRDAFRHTKI